MHPRDAALAALSARQYQVWNHQQALDAGFPKQTIYNRRRSGLWVTLGHKVYGSPGVPASPERSLMAATLGLRDAAVSHEAAAWLHGANYVGSTQPTVTVPVRSTHRFPGVVVRESTDLTDDQLVVVQGLVTTNVERCLADLAMHLRPKRFRRVVQDALGRQLTTWEALIALHEKLGRRGKPGTALLEEVLASLGPGLDIELSELEWRFLELVENAGLPRPDLQFHLPWYDSPEGIVDCAWAPNRLLVELDGRRWHTRDERFDTDLRREAEAAVHGWQLARYTWKHVTKESGWVLDNLVRRLDVELTRRSD